MAHTCSECTYLKIDGNKYDGQYWCENLKECRYAYERECRYYCEARKRSDDDRKDALDYSNAHKPTSSSGSGCFITTTLCKILSLPDDHICLQTLRWFRNNYLQKSEEGLKILAKYDVVGPEISKRLSQDSGMFNVAYILLKKYIEPIVDLLDKKKYEAAKAQYTEMTNKLINFYHIDDTVDINIENIDATKAGHGKVYLKNA